MTAKSRHTKALKTASSNEKLFRFMYDGSIVVIAGTDLHDAKCQYQEKYGEWPANA